MPPSYTSHKSLLLPMAIIVAVGIAGYFALTSGDRPVTNAELIASSETTKKTLRALELSIPGMFCAGCTASVEANIAPLAGVERIDARLSPSKSASIVYNSDVISPNDIILNEIFAVYGGATILSDEIFNGSTLTEESDSGVPVPEEVQVLSTQVAALLQKKEAEGKDIGDAKGLFSQVNSNIANGNFEAAKSILNAILNIASNL